MFIYVQLCLIMFIRLCSFSMFTNINEQTCARRFVKRTNMNKPLFVFVRFVYSPNPNCVKFKKPWLVPIC